MNGGVKEESLLGSHAIFVSDLPSQAHVDGRGGREEGNDVGYLEKWKKINQRSWQH